jgi:uncharacterized membrane protein
MSVEISGPSPVRVRLICVAGYGACAVLAGLFIAWCFHLKAHHAGPVAISASAFVFTVLVFGVSSWTGRLTQARCGPVQSAARKRYMRRLMFALSAYSVLLVSTLSIWKAHAPTGLAAYTLAFVPALPLLACILTIGLYLKEEEDEFVRFIAGQSALAASGALLAIGTVWGFLEHFDLAPRISTWLAFPVWTVLFGAMQALIRRRYR